MQNGFKPSGSGQTWKKKSKDKDKTFEVHFQSLTTNTEYNIEVIPHINIYSKKVNEFQNVLGLHLQGYFWGAPSIGVIMPENKHRTWDFGGASFDAVCETINDSIEKYAIPIFNLFENKDDAVRTLLEKGCKLNEYMKT